MTITAYQKLQRNRGDLSRCSQDGVTKLDFIEVKERQKPGGGIAEIVLSSGLNSSFQQDRKYGEYAMVNRRRINEKGEQAGGDLEIQSKFIRRAISKTFGRYCILADPIVIEKPYYPLWHFRENLEHFMNQVPRDSEEADHLNVLQRFMDKHLAPLRKAQKRLVNQGRISFEHLPMIFRPGEIIFSQKSSQKQCYLLHSVDEREDNEKGKYLQLNAFAWRYDGERFGPFLEVLKIFKFSGPLSIRELDFFPISFVPDSGRDTLVDELLERGRKWCQFINTSHMSYEGKTNLNLSITSLTTSGFIRAVPRRPHEQKEITDTVPSFVKGRVILDYESFIEANPQYDIALFHTVEGSKKEDVDRDDDSSFWSDEEDEDDHEEDNAAMHQVTIGSRIIRGAIFRSYTKKEFNSEELDQLQALLCPPTSAGFSLADKIWGFFDVDKAQDIQWRDNMLENVEIDPTYKQALSDLVKYHFSSSSETSNLLSNKGKALIMLLYGAPGCGKTATAEAIAERERRPLYVVSSGELGCETWYVEYRVRKLFDRATAWKAIVLIDEADVFLSKRTHQSQDLHRDGLVSLFLRYMEYFEGCLFLTTNRVRDFDSAVMSRVKLPLHYPSLNDMQRANIWYKTLIKENIASSWDFGRCQYYGKMYKRNGRDIFNLLDTAIALAKQRKMDLTEDLVQETYKLMFRDRDQIGTESAV